jgi:nucleotide-binding universal stress UspA family protein
MMRRILIPLDGSLCSKQAMKEGLALAKALSAEVTFLHVLSIEPSIYSSSESLAYDPKLIENEKATARAILEEAKLAAEAALVKAETKLIEDGAKPAVKHILEAETAFDLVVMATHGRSGLDRLVLGSVTEGVLRRSSKPHLIVRCQQEG